MVPARLPIGAFHRGYETRAVPRHHLFEVTGEVADAERAHTARKRTAFRAMIAKFARVIDQVGAIGIASRRVARKSVGVGSHLFALAREVPLALTAHAFALAPARAVGQHQARV